MVCIVVTRGGEGALWRFDSTVEAGDHPITQPHDAFCGSVQDVLDSFRWSELPSLFSRLLSPREAEATRSLQRPGEIDRRHFAERAWEMMQARAVPPPTDPAAVFDLIVADRRATRLTGIRVRSSTAERDTTMTEAAQAEAATTKTSAVRAKRYSDTSIITMGTAADGVKYGPDKNPKKVGSASHELFARYVDGMTVAEAAAAGIPARALAYDSDKGFISIA